MDDSFVSQVVTSMGFSDQSTSGYHEVVGHFHKFMEKEYPEVDEYRAYPKFFTLVKWFGDWMEAQGIFVEDLLKNDDGGDEEEYKSMAREVRSRHERPSCRGEHTKQQGGGITDDNRPVLAGEAAGLEACREQAMAHSRGYMCPSAIYLC